AMQVLSSLHNDEHQQVLISLHMMKTSKYAAASPHSDEDKQVLILLPSMNRCQVLSSLSPLLALYPIY
ncbi:hypothetical protein ACQP3C_28805, partial [Escherichia coli]